MLVRNSVTSIDLTVKEYLYVGPVSEQRSEATVRFEHFRHMLGSMEVYAFLVQIVSMAFPFLGGTEETSYSSLDVGLDTIYTLDFSCMIGRVPIRSSTIFAIRAICICC